ncbi:MAG TPA: hypothetical protein VMX96_04365 [Dehalococcoidia bacterium]|nr:hypothetical protein [Dehalococcoidia bacterium]
MSTRYEYYDAGATAVWAAQGNSVSAQTFTPSVAHIITSVKIKAFRVGSPGTVTASIRATDVNGKPTGVDLCSGTIDGNGFTTDTAGVLYEITLGAGTALAASTKYAILIKAPSGDTSNYVQGLGAGGNPYAGGQLCGSSDNGVNWTIYADYDKNFEDWGTTTQTIAPTSIASAEAFGTPTVAPGPVTVSPPSIASGEAFGTPTVALVPLHVFPSSIPSAESFGKPNLKYDQVIAPPSIASAEAFGVPTVAPGPVTVYPTTIASAEAFGVPFVCHYVGVTSYAVAACSYGSSVYLFRIGLDGHLYRRQSADNGVSWAAWVDMGDITGTADFRLACCFKDADEAIVLYSTGASIYRRRLSGGTWEAAAAWTNSLNSITGIAVTYMGDWNVAVTGTDTADCPGLWTCILGDGYSGAVGTWYSLNALMSAEYGSGISYHFPTLDMPDVFRMFFIETYSGTEAYSMPFFTYSLPTADFIDNLWREPVPFNLSSEYGIHMAHAGGSVFLSCPYGYWTAVLTPASVDLTGDLTGAHLSLKPLSGELSLLLRNDDGRYNSPSFTRGCDIRLKLGYHTAAGAETAGYLPIVTIDSIERTLKKGRSVVTLHALDGWSLLYNWIARYQFSWAASEKNIFQLLSFVFARAGIALSSYSTSSRITAYEPAFTIHPGERGITAVKRLLSLVEDVILFVR